jgi:hypothetical protein
MKFDGDRKSIGGLTALHDQLMAQYIQKLIPSPCKLWPSESSDGGKFVFRDKQAEPGAMNSPCCSPNAGSRHASILIISRLLFVKKSWRIHKYLPML